MKRLRQLSVVGAYERYGEILQQNIKCVFAPAYH